MRAIKRKWKSFDMYSGGGLNSLQLPCHALALLFYMKLCRAGGSVGYFELLKLAGLQSPFDEETIKNTIEAVASILEERRCALSAAK